MRFALLMSVAMMSLSPALSFAADCNCSKQCMEDCKNGKGDNCKCQQKDCDCKKTGKCSEGHCKTKHQHNHE